MLGTKTSRQFENLLLLLLKIKIVAEIGILKKHAY